MSIQTILLPHKHVRFSDSIVGLAGHLRGLLNEPRTVDELWSLVDGKTTSWPGSVSFTNLVLAIDVLFAIGQVELTADSRVISKTQ